MFKILLTTLFIVVLFILVNGTIHLSLFFYTFDYPIILAKINMYALFITWLLSGLLMKSEEQKFKQYWSEFIKRTKLLCFQFVILFIYVAILTLWGMFKFNIFFISFAHPIDPVKARILSASSCLLFYVPLLILYSSIKHNREQTII